MEDEENHTARELGGLDQDTQGKLWELMGLGAGHTEMSYSVSADDTSDLSGEVTVGPVSTASYS